MRNYVEKASPILSCQIQIHLFVALQSFYKDLILLATNKVSSMKAQHNAKTSCMHFCVNPSKAELPHPFTHVEKTCILRDIIPIFKQSRPIQGSFLQTKVKMQQYRLHFDQEFSYSKLKTHG